MSVDRARRLVLERLGSGNHQRRPEQAPAAAGPRAADADERRRRMTTAALLQAASDQSRDASLRQRAEMSVDQCAAPQSVTEEVETIGLLVPIQLIHDLGRADFLIAAAARLAATEASPQLRRPLARQLTGINPASDLLGERYIATSHIPPNICRLALPCPPRIASTCTQSTEAQA